LTQPKKVLVVGASGFVGGHVCAALSKSGFDVIGATRSERGELSSVRSRVVAPDTGDYRSWLAAMEGADTVINVAGLAHSPTAGRTEYHLANVRLPTLLGEAAVRAGVPNFIHLSSVAAATHTASPGSAKRKLTDRDSYAASKVEGEQEVLAQSNGATIVIVLRAPMVYGSRMRGNPLRLFSHVMRDRLLILPPDENARSVLYAGNLADAIVTIVLKRPARAGMYAIADERPVSTRTFATAAAHSLGREARIISVPVRLLRILGYAGDILSSVTYSPVTSSTIEGLVDSLVVDDAAFRADFSWTPPVKFSSAIALTGAWYLSERASIDAASHHSRGGHPPNGKALKAGNTG
jgi:nucleoside-diphosphate-sugar epimerase